MSEESVGSNSESLFGELDFKDVSDNPFEIPDNSYLCYLTDVRVGPTKDKSKVGMTLFYTINEGDHRGKQITEWKNIPRPTDPKNPSEDDKRAMSFLKARMKDLGIPEERINSVKPEDLVGIKCTVVVKNKDGYTNVRRVTRVADEFTLSDAQKQGEVSDPFSAGIS